MKLPANWQAPDGSTTLTTDSGVIRLQETSVIRLQEDGTTRLQEDVYTTPKNPAAWSEA